MNMWKTLNKGIMKAFGMNIETDTATLNDESFLEWVGIKRDSESKKPTSDVTYFTCLKMMSETVAKMPWKLYQKTNKGISEPIDNDIASRTGGRRRMSEAGKQIIRSRTKSFRDIYVAPVTQNDATAYAAGTPVKLARAISGKVSDKFSVEKIYSDDGVEDTVETYEGTDVEFEVNSLAPQDKAMLFGHLYKNGWLVKNKDDKAPEVAVGYRAKKLNGKYEFVWLYVGTFGQGYDDNYQTQEDKVTTQTATLKGSFYERACDGNFETQVDESNLMTEHTDAAAAIKNWFGKVQEPTEAA